MSSRKIEVLSSSQVSPCPKCGNKTKFVIHSEQCSEDGCEIWATCTCGYDPSKEPPYDRMEDVWGSLDDSNCINAVCYTWNEPLEEKSRKKLKSL